jgi:hypothetical protein
VIVTAHIPTAEAERLAMKWWESKFTTEAATRIALDISDHVLDDIAHLAADVLMRELQRKAAANGDGGHS